MTRDAPMPDPTAEAGAPAGFFQRWSRRKLDARTPAPGPIHPDVPSQPLPSEPPPTAPARELTDSDMPPLERLGPDSDYSMFLSRGVSETLRQAALRKLFHSPQYNKVCLCAEYAEDYTNFTPLGDVVPHELKRMLALEAERARDRTADAAGLSGDDSAGAQDPVAAAGTVGEEPQTASGRELHPRNAPASGEVPTET